MMTAISTVTASQKSPVLAQNSERPTATKLESDDGYDGGENRDHGSVLSRYFRYHHRTRTHLSLNKDCPQPRRIQPPSAGEIIAFPEVGGLHHRYERRAA